MGQSPSLIRELTEDDALAVIELVGRVAGGRTVLLTAEEFNPSEEDERRYLRRFRDRPGSLALGAFEGSLLVGVLFVEQEAARRRQHAGTLGMSVRPSHWNRKIGTALVAEMIERVRSRGVLRRVELGVAANNEAAIAIYRNHGFIEEGCRRGAYCIDGAYVDELVMALPLDMDTERE